MSPSQVQQHFEVHFDSLHLKPAARMKDLLMPLNDRIHSLVLEKWENGALVVFKVQKAPFFQGHHLKGHWTIRDSNQLHAADILSNTEAQSAGQEVTYYCHRCWSLGKSATALYPSPFQVISYTGTYLVWLPDQSQIYSFPLLLFLIHTKFEYIRVKVPRTFLQWKVRRCLSLIPLVPCTYRNVTTV